MVAEKPSICTSIANALSKGKCEGRGRSPPVYDFEGEFLGKKAFLRVTSVTGHVFSMDFPSQYQKWDAVEPVDLFSAPVKSNPEGKGGIVKHLEREAKGFDYLCLWLDCDREGENICFEVIRCVKTTMKGNIETKGSEQRIFRAKFSAVTPSDIFKAMQNLGEPNENESKAVEARQELDLKVGVAFSRFQTRFFQGRYGDLDSSVISYGPCQTPTLGFCVDRHDEISSFKPEPFWSLDVSVSASTGSQVALQWQRGRLFDAEVATTFMKIVSGDNNSDQSLKCINVKVSKSRRTRPQPMNTVELLKSASKSLGIGPADAMRSAESLYLSGMISYPRTESTAYPNSFNIKGAIDVHKNSSLGGVADYSRDLLDKGYVKPRSGHDAGDHPPITPVGVAHGLSGNDSRLYDLIVRHFLATVSPDAIFENTKITFDSIHGNESFNVKGKKEVDPGFLAIYMYHSRQQEEEGEADQWAENDDNDEDDYGDIRDLPEFSIGQLYPISKMRLKEGKTSAPGYMTESELIAQMERNGIGTDASIATHINNICTRNYVNLGSGRTLVPTPLGIVLVHGYLSIDPALVLPDVRAAIEGYCDLVAKGKANKEDVVAHSLSNFEAKFRYFEKNIGRMDALFEASFSPLAASGKLLSRCGKCLRYMRYIPLKPQRLYCNTCECTYGLPQNGTIKLYKELKCPLDNFELVLFSLGNTAGAQGKSFPLCPYCYNHPPHFADMEDTGGEVTDGDEGGIKKDVREKEEKLNVMGCDSCMHPSCKHSLIKNGICPCPVGMEENEGGGGADCSGTLVIDVNSRPNWKLCCNRCNTILKFTESIHQLTPLHDGECEECGSKLLQFEFNKGDTAGIKKGCIMCNDELNAITQIASGRTMNLKVVRQIRHKRGAGGRGGRGRGRGRGRGKSGRTKDGKPDLMAFDCF